MEKEWKDPVTWDTEEEELARHEGTDVFDGGEDAFWCKEDCTCLDGCEFLTSYSEQYYDC